MFKHDDVYLGRNVDDLVECDVVRSKVEMKEEVKEVDNVGNKVQGKQTLQWEQRLFPEQLRGGKHQVKSVAELHTGKELIKEQKNEQIKEEQMSGKESTGIDARGRREESNQEEEEDMRDKGVFRGAEKGELSMNQGNLKKMEKFKQEEEQRGERHNSDDEEGDEEIGFLVMADCIDQCDEDRSAPAKFPNANACSKTSAARQRSSKKPAPKLIKSVIDIDDDEGSRTHIRHQEDTNLLYDIKTVRVKKVIRMTSTSSKKAQPLVAGNNKEKKVESPSLPPVGAVIGSGNQARREDVRKPTTITLGIKRFEAYRLIGHQGKNIRELEQKTGARISVSDRIGEMQSVEIHGNSASVAKAKAEVEKYFFSNCTTKVKVSEEVARALYANEGKVWSDIKADCKVFLKGLREGADDVIYLFGSEVGEREAKARLEEFANSMTVPH